MVRDIEFIISDVYDVIVDVEAMLWVLNELENWKVMHEKHTELHALQLGRNLLDAHRLKLEEIVYDLEAYENEQVDKHIRDSFRKS